MDEYRVGVQCTNCGYVDMKMYPKGQLALAQIEECPNCGCESTRKILGADNRFPLNKERDEV